MCRKEFLCEGPCDPDKDFTWYPENSRKPVASVEKFMCLVLRLSKNKAPLAMKKMGGVSEAQKCLWSGEKAVRVS